MALAAIASILFAAGCGSSSPTANKGGFGPSSLTGTYVFSSDGVDASGYPLALAGTLVANGSGGITGGTIDVIDPAITNPPTTAAQSITSGSYTVGIDGRGKATLKSSYPTFTLDFVLTSTSHGLVSEFDSYGTGSGTIDLQTAVTSLSQLAGPYAFSLAGSDSVNSGLNPFAAAGAFTLNASGASTAGVEDFNDNGIVYTGESLTATATLGSGTGPGAITLTANLGTLTFDFYPIDSTHWKIIETDYAEFFAGDVFTQTGASIPTGTMVFTMAGGNSTTDIANGGFMTSDGTGNFSNGLEDININGAVSPAQLAFSGSATSGTASTRVVVALSGFDPATQWVIYPSSGRLLMLETDSSAVTTGAAYAQSATSFTAPGGYGLNLSGINANGPVNYIAQFDATSTASPAANMTGILDDNEYAVTAGDLSLSGTYTPDSPADGRGLITAPTTGSLGTYNGELILQYYVVDDSTVVFIDVDSSSEISGGQVGAGTFEAQSSSLICQLCGVARRAISMVRPLVHPAVRPHAALQRK
jgi:hypothetical protein